MSFVPRKPPSLVQKLGIQRGRSPLGREEGSRGTFMEWFPGRVFAFFRRAAKEGRSRRSEISLVLLSSPPQRTNLQSSTDSPFASAFRSLVPSPPAGLFLCSAQRKRRKKCAKGNLSRRRFPLESFPIGQGAAAPLRSPGDYEGRETGVWTGGTDCHTRCAGSQ